MHIYVDESKRASGKRAAEIAAEKIQASIEKNGYCRLLLSTGASQFDVLDELTKKNLDWSKVTMFHLDEYVGMSIDHIASFRKYLTERFVNLVHPGAYFFVNGEGDVEKNLQELTKEIRKARINVALIGIGENGHIAFNDPPADFDTKEAYKVVNLDEKCRRQQMGEGWFKTFDEVPKQAISMTPYQIMDSECILSIVPDARKADAIQLTFEAKETTNMVPATLLKTHPDVWFFLDEDSASKVDRNCLK